MGAADPLRYPAGCITMTDANLFDLLLDRIARDLADVIITDAVKRDPDRVMRVGVGVVADLKRQGRYDADEIDRAVAELYQELGLPLRGRFN
jgi:hypothetical protein